MTSGDISSGPVSIQRAFAYKGLAFWHNESKLGLTLFTCRSARDYFSYNGRTFYSTRSAPSFSLFGSQPSASSQLSTGSYFELICDGFPNASGENGRSSSDAGFSPVVRPMSRASS